MENTTTNGNASSPHLDSSSNAPLTTYAPASMTLTAGLNQLSNNGDANATTVNTAHVDVSVSDITRSEWSNIQSTNGIFASIRPGNGHVDPYISTTPNVLPTANSQLYYSSANMTDVGPYRNHFPLSVRPNMASTQFANPYVSPTLMPTFGNGSITTSFIQQPSTTRWCPNTQPINATFNNYLPFETPNPPPTAHAFNNMWRPSTLTQQPDFHADVTLSQSQISSRQVISKDLPIFSGHPEDWPLFITNFEQSTERCGFSNQENLIRLQRCLKGPALEAVRGKLMMPSTVPLALDTLRMLFGRPDAIHDALQRKLRQTPPVKIDRLETLINLALAVQNYRATMEAIGLIDYLNDPMLLNDLLNKLPGDMKLDFGRRRMEAVRVDIGVFDDWLFKIATCARLVTPTTIQPLPATEEKTNRKGHKERVFLHDSSVVKGTRYSLCSLCDDQHPLQECPSFIAMSRQNRWKFIKEKRLCIRCFKNHMIRRCNSKKQCGVDDCCMSHNPLLHSNSTNISGSGSGGSGSGGSGSGGSGSGDGGIGSGDSASRITPNNNNNKSERENFGNQNKTQNNTVLLHSSKRSVLFRCIPVTLYGNDVTINTLALIDEGSSISLIDSNLANQLRVDGPSNELCMKWTGNVTQTEQNSKCISVSISSQATNSRIYKMLNIRTISNMDLPEQSLDATTIKAHPHLKSLPIQLYEKTKPRILIGLDNVKLTTPLESRESESDGVVSTRCRLGWSVYGREYLDQVKFPRIMHICDCSKINEMEKMMRYFFSLESVGIHPNIKPLISKDDEQALKIMEAKSKYLESEKRWETGLLWRYKNIDLPDSLPMARKRLECLERKMMRDSNLNDFIATKIKDYLEKGYIKRLPPKNVGPNGKSWYLPIFVVTNVNKNKLRLVWDAAAKVKDVSLNSVLFKGPDMMMSLIGILIRFRERQIAVCGDIREMFHQVRIRESDQIAQKFLWRDGDVSREPDTYVMTVMTFGASCSPSLANYIKNRNADRFLAQYPKAVSAIKQNTFVDDWLQSVDSEMEMKELSNKVKFIHSEGGFEMRNWISNSKPVLESLNGCSSVPKKCLGDVESQHEKILGLLGFFVVEAKIILQDVWRSGVSWDDPIEEAEKILWTRWISKLKNISLIRIPRRCPISSRNVNTELHIFVDASIQAYAAVAYFRSTVGNKSISNLILSKTRVAPLRPISVPRMELMAAILGLRLAKFIQNEMSIEIKQRVFWTDSKDVLFWIRSDARKFHQFVAVRVGEILEESNINEWRWVPSTYNVADDGTKISSNTEIHENYRWFNGPEYLCDCENEWPVNDVEHHVQLINETIHELAVTKPKDNWISSPDPKRFSKWEKLRMAQMYVLRFIQHLKKKPFNKSENISPIRISEMILIKNCQRDEYFEEVNQIQSLNKVVSRNSSIFKLSPYLDEFGVLRMKGRIDAAPHIAFDVKRPIILPRNHTVTQLIANFYHRKFHHHHAEIVVNEMRQRFYIPGMRALVRQITRSCQRCKNQRSIPSSPEMGNLPAERITPFTRPFTFTGVDYFGPMDVVVGRRHEKRWGVLFTCMTVRAVHIEISPSLSTDSFLLILKQFISRRGVPRRIFTDNATNFRGASRILAEEIEKVSYDNVECDYPEIEWYFIPPASPHMGGAWERMIRSVKSILNEILPQTGLREEVLRAALADVENILNMRPLTYIPLNSAEAEALTPNHFLLGSSSGVRERGDPDSCGTTLSRNLRIAGQIADSFWRRWVRECLPCLTKRTKWYGNSNNPIAVGDVVIIVDDNTKRNTWTKARVIDVVKAKDGKVRSAVIKTSSGISTRPVVKLARLELVNSTSTHEVYGGGNVKSDANDVSSNTSQTICHRKI